ncbi:MAG TPA: hypothetical protein VFG54_09790 [Prolixibacteraceae bacterium]|nr:hypothetical protein [Prolixibacteraceae bacterium]
MLLVLWAIAFQAPAQKRKMLLVPLTQAWKLEAKSGAGMMLTEVPDHYLWILNDVNIPVQVPGLCTTLSLRKTITRHLEAGYMLSFSDFSGDVQQRRHKYLAHTMGLEHSFQLLYNFRPTDNFRQRFNYFAWYKFGLVSLKNDVSLYLNSGRLYRSPDLQVDDFFTSYAVIGTGVGLGMNYRIATDLNVVGAYEYNRSTDAISDVYKIYKIFYPSPNTVNHYSSVSLGLSYNFDLVEARKKNISYYHRRSELGKRLSRARITYKSKRQAKRGRA